MTQTLLRKRTGLIALALLFALLTAACGGQQAAKAPAQGTTPAPQPAKPELSGTITIDGSSTVFPITEAVAEEFQKKHPKVKVTVGVSGTGGGMKKFTAGEIDIADASRPMKKEEAEAAKAKGIEAVELAVAYDGLSVVINKDNDFIKCLTVDELKKIWEPNSQVKTWNQVRAAFPNQPIKLFGPGTDSGTFEYFTEAINHKAKASRSDYTPSEDDNVLVRGVAGDKYSLGYFGYAYYAENKDKLKVIGVDAGKGKGCVEPSDQTINDGSYAPLSRPIFIYPAKGALKRPEVAEFVKFYLQEAPKLVKQVGYTPLPGKIYQDGLAKVEAALK